ncbi:hypothetical protein D3C76_1516330 [compost metagenome]
MIPKAIQGLPLSISSRINLEKSALAVCSERPRRVRVLPRNAAPVRYTFMGSSKVNTTSTLPQFQEVVSQVSRKPAPQPAITASYSTGWPR